MERLWAPWRLQYVKGTDDEKDGCVFCLSGEVKDRDKLILDRGKTCFVIMNIYPYNNGHIMVAPYRHLGDFSLLTSEEKCEIMELLSKWTDIIKRTMYCHGFNIGINLGRIAGAGIADHIHFHIVPRWNGDTNFMPVIGDAKVLPESLEQCYNSLKNKMLELEDGAEDRQ